MARKIVFLIAVTAPLLAASPFSLAAVKSPALASCSAEWAKMKQAKTIPEGQTWSKFWSQCRKDYAAAHGYAATGGEATAPSTENTKTAAVNENEPAGSLNADKQACDGKWHDYKTSSGAHGWKAYFTFMAKCMP